MTLSLQKSTHVKRMVGVFLTYQLKKYNSNMKNFKNMIWAITLLSLTTLQVGCNDDTPIQGTGNNNDTVLDVSSKEQIDNLLETIAPATQSFTVDASSPIQIVGEQGFRFNFPANSFVDANGDAVTGNVEVKLLEITNKTQMLATGITTVSGNTLLISGGMFDVQVSQGGKELSLAPGRQFTVRIPNDGDPDPSMQLFRGEETGDEENPIRWNEDVDSSWVNSQERDSFYNINLNFLRWCNLDKYMGQGLDLTKLSVKLPKNFTNSNTRVFLFIENDNGAVTLFGDKDLEEFNTGSYEIPVGFKVKIIALGEIDDEMYYKIVSTTVVDNHSETITEMDKISEDDLEDILKNL
jgi:hypothetical protein